MVQDSTKILWNLNQFWKRSYSIKDQIISNPAGSLSILENKIVQDPMGWIWDLREG